MNKRAMDRREFVKTAALAAGMFSTGALASAAEKVKAPSFLTSKPKMKLGTVTYNLAKDWEIEMIIKNCEAAKFDGVELRTEHKHGVELTLSKEQRAEVKKKFQNSKVELMGLGGTYDYHTPDPAKLRKDIDATKEYIVLAQEVGASGVKVRPNGFPKEVPKEKTLEQIGTALKELGEFAKEHGQMIRLEVHGSGTSLVPNIKTILDVANHPNVGACWNSNPTDLEGDGWDANFNLIKHKIVSVHMRDLSLEDYPFRKLLTGLNETGYTGYCLAEIPETTDPVRVMKYYRALWLAYQGLL
ncbi:MAG: sugar phosphate isomerase/epimerase [Verrucomicrobiota bacterium]